MPVSVTRLESKIARSPSAPNCLYIYIYIHIYIYRLAEAGESYAIVGAPRRSRGEMTRCSGDLCAPATVAGAASMASSTHPEKGGFEGPDGLPPRACPTTTRRGSGCAESQRQNVPGRLSSTGGEPLVSRHAAIRARRGSDEEAPEGVGGGFATDKDGPARAVPPRRSRRGQEGNGDLFLFFCPPRVRLPSRRSPLFCRRLCPGSRFWQMAASQKWAAGLLAIRSQGSKAAVPYYNRGGGVIALPGGG
ncbi:hypothetical protein LX36DRAFT_387799 [Colletotrichum falcatum]|nr:hypothetical protein LX36DRAFT_387799 [Colletotrichum falcatum]